jgi:Fe-S oxidoreductase
LLNPGVILNSDPQAHLKSLKPLPAADPIVDKCIERGVCEPKCPSAGLTLSPRQRIVGWREIAPRPATVAVHPVCSARKMGTADKLTEIARRCAANVVTVDEVQCCGFAGDRGFTHPELSEHALRHLRAALPTACEAGYSTSRTCEIGLSEFSGRPYRSIIQLVDACVEEHAR